MTTQVVRIKRRKGEIVVGCDVYIGRAMYMGGWQLPESKWHNPFKVGKDGTIDEVLEKYRNYVISSDLVNSLHDLKGKTLGCWCGNGKCHGDVLVDLIVIYCT